MTIEQRQADAEAWVYAYADWQAAEEQAAVYDALRVSALNTLKQVRERLESNAAVGTNVRSRVYMLPATNNRTRELVKVTYIGGAATGSISIELLKTEPK